MTYTYKLTKNGDFAIITPEGEPLRLKSGALFTMPTEADAVIICRIFS